MATPALHFTTPPRPRPTALGDMLQHIAERSPKDLKAIEVLTRLVIARLDAEDQRSPQ